MRFVLAALIATCAFSVRADWELAAVNEPQSIRIYVDPDTIKFVGGNIRRAWGLVNHPKDNDGARSSRLLSEYDCTNERVRLLSYAKFSKPDARGDTKISSEGEGSWSYVPPGTVLKSELDFVCNYKKR